MCFLLFLCACSVFVQVIFIVGIVCIGVIIQSLRAFRRAELRGRSLGGVGGPLGVPARQGGVPGGRRGGPLALLGSHGGPREVVARALWGSGRPWGVPGSPRARSGPFQNH